MLIESSQGHLYNNVAVTIHTRPFQQKSLDKKLSFGGCQLSPPPVLELLISTPLTVLFCTPQLNPISSTLLNPVFETCYHVLGYRI